MSGVNWIPAWATAALNKQRFRVVSANAVSRAVSRSWFTDHGVIAAQALLAGQCATALAGHPALWAWIDIKPDEFYTPTGSQLARLHLQFCERATGESND